MHGPTPFRDIALVAGFEFRDMFRSRLALAILAVYLLASALATYGLVFALVRTEAIAADPAGYLAGAAGRRDNRPAFDPGYATSPKGPSQAALFARGSPFLGMLRRELSEPGAVEYIVAKPPIALYFMYVAIIMVPFLVVVTSSISIARDYQSGGMRFVMLRTGKLEYALGKFAAQALLMAAVTLLAAGVSFQIAAWKLRDFEWGPAVSATMVFWPRLVAYCLPFVAAAMAFSMVASSVFSALTFALLGLAGLFLVHQLPATYVGTWFAGPAGALDYMVPYSHQDKLWLPMSGQVAANLGLLAALAAIYFAVGLLFFRRRDT